ncbi:glycosyltransferase [Sandarakinorhabdus sp.]|uniref:glycosyltransferase family 2 protein n=1 Tax=Sandarakinorhabdus sp. TaxID=1916663 RepID=UPI00286E7CCF|nr:glycosyltransferase [Sandarakinorhabdus sp.]
MANDPADTPLWAIIIPFYNEQDFIAPTLRCALAQDWPSLAILLIDNGSTDGSAALVAGMIAGDPRARLVHEGQPGQTFALRTGFGIAQEMGAAKVALWDADTLYRPDYIARADALMGTDETISGAMAIDLYAQFDAPESRLQRRRLALTARILSKQCHTGTFGQSYRVSALAAAGGPKNDTWPLVLHDHETAHRVLKHGRTVYDADHVCWPSPRRTQNSHVRWNLTERLMYHVTPFALKDWFFYRFLAPRLKARRMYEAGLRVRDWEQ